MDFFPVFSTPGLLLALAILAPSLLLLRFPPVESLDRVMRASPVAEGIERSGQMGCLILLSLSGATAGTRPAWLILAVLLVAGYWALWLRYLRGGRTLALLFGPLGAVPIPLALTPIAAFAAASAWSGSILLLGATVVLAAGHIPVSITAWRSVRDA
ncbi:hypothetical protein [Mycetocola spongiae]|uniref:hypothetical protein n=1 Tax=Mycetocola spongiae TaxID=2859226 RepID=UPI001CF51325|nr:hypothetical protein [Mycetocola spongiae]UCR89879.1 hypothetical protein KXZ72_04215 [Mycetocola spongiae]